MQHSSQKILIESERFNNTPPRVSFTIEEEIFGPQYEGILDRSIHYRNIQLTGGQFFGFRGKGISIFFKVHQISRRPVSRIPLDVDFG
ncbi:unnamed protein product [Rhizophagus irregularis]|nr:unnamed protein product [Rhizophagus irregularis]